jgi:carbon monoxide dehydrogenase subunit G
MIRVQTGIRIERAAEDVFDILSDPLRFPSWNSAVESVQHTSGRARAAGSKYSMWRELPGGRVENELEIAGLDHPTEFAIRTTSGPTPFVYRYRVSPDGGGTVVTLDGSVALPRPAALVASLAARAVKRGVDANLDTLKRILEAPALRYAGS